MIALSLLLGLCVYILVAWRVTSGIRKISSCRVAVIAGCTFFALPVLDALIGHAALEVLCRTEGEIFVHQIIPGVTGIGVESSVNANSPTNYGVQYIEGDLAASNKHQLTRITLAQDGLSYTREFPVSAKSTYLLKNQYWETSAYFHRQRTIVVNRTTGQEVAGFTWFWFRGGWAERVLFLGGTGPACGSGADWSSKMRDLLNRTFPDARPASLR